MSSWTYLTWQISSCYLLYDLNAGCCSTATNTLSFWNSDTWDDRIPHIDILPLQSARASGYRTMPSRCAETLGAIHFMFQPLVVMLQLQTSPIFQILNAVIREFSTLICSYYSQPGPRDIILDLSNEPNLLVPSISWSGCWLLSYSNKHRQFPEFRIAKCKNAPHWCASTTDS